MRTIVYGPLLLFLVGLLILSSCTSKKERFEVITTRIQYDVPITGQDPDLDWWINNIEGSRREPFVKRIMEGAESGEFKAFDYFYAPLTPEQVKAINSDTAYMTLVREIPPYEQYDTMVVYTTDYRDIVKMRFLEEWTWDPASLEFQKKVIGIAPLAAQKVGDEVYNRFLFWIFPGGSAPVF